MTPESALDRGLAELAITLPPGGKAKLLQYTELMAKWNKIYNLTAIRNPPDMVTHHVLDSLAVVPHLELAAAASIADVGSGAGLPGVPLAIARPDWRVTLNDANAKKAAFLRQVVMELKLANTVVHEGRVERWNPVAPFAAVISRAFAELADFVAACRHLLAPQGVLAAMKGLHPAAEIARVPSDCDCSRVIVLKVPLVAAGRHLVLCRLSD
jgi:16S rRNA (guanine527-N7)-methyltransferase